jgi:hypothetical protein
MKPNQNPATQNLDRLLAIFAGKRIAFWLAVAIAIHIVVIGGCSVNTIYDRWIDPEGAKQRKQAAIEERQRAELAAAAAAAPAVAGLTNAAAVVRDINAPATPAAATETPPDVIPADRATTPVAKRLTEVAKPEEMPKLGNDLGISIEDTGIR